MGFRQNAGMEKDDSRVAEGLWERWLEPFQAVKALMGAGIENRDLAINWLKGRLKGGGLLALGWHHKFNENFEITNSYVAGYKLKTWDHIDQIGNDHDFWISGEFTSEHLGRDRTYSSVLSLGYREEGFEFPHTLDRVRFDPSPIEAFCERAKQGGDTPVELKPVQGGRRGAKRKDWWDHLWLEVIRRLQAGTLQPTSVADLQRTLEDYASHQLNVEPGDSTLKPMASNLFKFLQDNSGKFGGN
jgi:hypothetical protein